MKRRSRRTGAMCSPDDLPSNGDEASFETELEWIVTDGYSRIILCEPGEPLSVSGPCWEEPWMLDEAERIGVAIPDDATLGHCWDNGNMAPVISRTMVIDGDELVPEPGMGLELSEAPATLQVNDLGSFERIGRVRSADATGANTSVPRGRVGCRPDLGYRRGQAGIPSPHHPSCRTRRARLVDRRTRRSARRRPIQRRRWPAGNPSSRRRRRRHDRARCSLPLPQHRASTLFGSSPMPMAAVGFTPGQGQDPEQDLPRARRHVL